MRIEIQPSVNLTKSDLKKLDKLKQGDVIKGSIIEITGDVAKIDLGNGEIAYGKLEIPLSLLKDKNLKFLIKDIKGNILFLSPVYEDIDFNKEFVLKNKDLIMDRILNLNNLTKDEINLNIIKDMISFRMPLSSENIASVTKHVDKLLSILNLQEDESIQILSTAKDPLNEDINKLIKTKNEGESRVNNATNNVVKNAIDSYNQVQKKEVPQVIEESVDTKVLKNNGLESKTQEPLNEDINKAIKTKGDGESKINNFNNTMVEENIKGSLDTKISKENTNVIKSSELEIMTDKLKQSLEENSEIKFKNITEPIKEELKNLFSENNISKNNVTENIIQKVVFLTKSEIDISINNLDRLTRLIERGETLNKALEEVVRIALKDGIIDEKTKTDILSKIKGLDIKFDNNDSEKIKEFYKELSETIEKISLNISSKEKTSEELNLKTKNLSENIDFLNKINDKSTLMLIPFNLNNKDIENNLYILSKRRTAKKMDNLTVYISLNTNNLENIKVLCDFSYDRLSVNFKVKEDYLNLFEKNKESLKSTLQSKGYENVLIYTNKYEEENVLDLISYENSINYMLNVKV